MRPLIERLFDTAKYTSLADKDRARLVYGATALIMVLYAIFAGFSIHPLTGRSALQEAAINPQQGLYIALFYLIGVGTILSTRRGWIRLSVTGPTLMVYIAGGLGFIQYGFARPIEGVALAMFILFAGLLSGDRGLVVATVLALATFAVGLGARANPPLSPPQAVDTYDLISIPLGLLTISSLTYLFLRFARMSRIEGASREVAERLKLAEITSQTARRVASRLALSEVLSNAVEEIRANYPDIYHAQIFLVDEAEQEARLAASTGEIGKFLMQRRHSLNVGSLSVIGHVTLTGESVIARADDPNSIHQRNEALPETSAEAAFPLRIGAKVIGALDLQSRVATAFREDDMPSFQLLADHIAVAIDNARLFEETEERLRENQHLVEQARSAVREVERLNRQLTGRAWAEYLHGKGEQLNRSVDFTDNTVRPEDTWTPTMQEAVQYNYVAQSQQGDAQVIAIPIRVRGQVIGAIEFELDKESSLAPEDLALIQEVGERFGLAAENMRLFERSQRIAQREALVNEIGVRLQASNNIEATLAEAARSLKQTLRADKVAIRLGTPPAAYGNGGGEQ
jgi:GAF domain-containing protein